MGETPVLQICPNCKWNDEKSGGPHCHPCGKGVDYWEDGSLPPTVTIPREEFEALNQLERAVRVYRDQMKSGTFILGLTGNAISVDAALSRLAERGVG